MERTSRMNEPKANNESPANPDANVPPANSDEAAAGDSPAPSQLTKEEQWALFEKELKESDWGHQPC
jgi:hypothetical protein